MSGAAPSRDGAGLFAARLLTALESAGSPFELAPRAVSAAIQTLGDGCALWMWDRKTGELRLAGAQHLDPAKSPLFQQLMRSWFTPRHHETWHQVAELCRPAVWNVNGLQEAESLFGGRRQASLWRRVGVQTVAVAPLLHARRRVGVLAMVSAEPDIFSDRAKLSEVADMARHLGRAMALSGRLESARHTGQQLTLTSMRIRTILESVPQGVVVTDTQDGRVAFTNDSMSFLMGRAARNRQRSSCDPDPILLARPGGDAYPEEELPWVRSARTGLSASPEEMLVRFENGKTIPVLCSASPVRDEMGRAAGSVAILQDISEHKEFERHKDEFLAMVAHELRTPLTALKGYVQLIHRLMDKDPEAESRVRMQEMLQVSDQQIGRLTRMIHDLLDFSRIRSNRLDLLPITFSLGALAAGTVAQMKIAAPDHHLTAEVSGETGVYADMDRIEQVLLNLLSNALNATQPEGRIDVLVRSEGDEVVVTVRDDGTGIPAESREHLFEQLYRGAESRHRGMGLGLFISKGILDAHGGRIWFDTEVGRGTSFHFALRAAPAGGATGGSNKDERLSVRIPGTRSAEV